MSFHSQNPLRKGQQDSLLQLTEEFEFKMNLTLPGKKKKKVKSERQKPTEKKGEKENPLIYVDFVIL